MVKRIALFSAAALSVASIASFASATPMERAAHEIARYGGALVVFNDALNRVDQLADEMVELNTQMRNIQARADGEKRELTADEAKEIDTLMARFDVVEQDIERRRELEARNQRLAAPQGRRTDPDGAQASVDPAAPSSPVRRALPSPRDPNDAGKWGFRSFGEFSQKVKAAAAKGSSTIDPRLIANAAPSEYGSEGTDADGGYAVPPDFRATIVKQLTGEDSLLARVDNQISSSNNITIPVDKTNPGSSNGIQAFWTSEAGQKQTTKPALDQVQIRLHKLAALVPVTDEMLEDVAQLTNYLTTKTPEVITAKVNDAIVGGSGSGEPEGILGSGGLITVDAESGQAADTVTYRNITHMWSRMHARYRGNAVWLINQDIEPQLQEISFPVGSGVTAVPAYMPPGGLSGQPFATLMNRPIISTEATSALGSVGDIILVDLKQYLAGTKVGGLRQDVSIHLWFDYDITAFRFVLRMGGKGWWDAPITPRNSQLTRSAYVALAERA